MNHCLAGESPGRTFMDVNEAKELLYLVLTNELDEETSREVFHLLAESEELREALRETAELMGFLEENLPKATLRYYSKD
jgi:hypothetical protein